MVRAEGGTVKGVVNTIKYHGLVTTAGNVVRLTPLSEMVLALAGGKDSGTLFDGLNAIDLAKLTAGNAAAQTVLIAKLKRLAPNNDASTVGDLLSGKFVAGGAGDKFDALLDELGGSNTETGKKLADIVAEAQGTPVKIKRFISLGDSLSDLGAYSHISYVAGTGSVGGRFTTNTIANATTKPAKLAVDVVADRLGVTLNPNGYEGYGQPLTKTALPGSGYTFGGTGYAQGGSRVKAPNGIGNETFTCAGTPLVCSAAATIPVTTQITRFLGENGDKFNADDLVFVLVGANDVFFQFGAVGNGLQTTAQAVAAMQQAATDLVTEVTRMQNKGAKYIVVSNLPDISTTPFGRSLGANGAALNSLPQVFNATLKAGLAGKAGVFYYDFYAKNLDVVANPAKYGFTNNTATVCDLAKIPGSSSLFCNPTNLIAGGDPTKYAFADGVHPTTAAHAVSGNLIYRFIDAVLP